MMKTRVTKKRSPHNRRTRGLCAALLFIFVFGAVLSLPASATGYIGAGDTSKMSLDLLRRLEASNDPTDTFVVRVWLNSISVAAIDAEMQETYGVSLQSFENEEIYYNQTLPAFEEELSHIFGGTSITQPMSTAFDSEISLYTINSMSEEMLLQNLREETVAFQHVSEKVLQKGVELDKSLLDLYTISQTNLFKEQRNNVVKNLIAEQNDVFFGKLEGLNYTVMYESRYVALLIMSASEEAIRYMSTLDEVFEINRCRSDNEYAAGSDGPEAQGYETSYTPERNTIASGLGVTIGVLEGVAFNDEEPGYYEGPHPHAPQLQNADITWLPFAQSADIIQPLLGASEHATYVLSILVGHPYRDEGGVYIDDYEGISVDASIVGITTTLDIDADYIETAFIPHLCGLEALLDENVDIINISKGVREYQYSFFDQFLDALVTQNNVLIVKSAGNALSSAIPANMPITSPGYGYNVITVGNVDPYDGQWYHVDEVSRYFQSSLDWATNKPDICAVGEARFPVSSDGSLKHNGDGTSYSAPRVAATLALILDARESLKTAPFVYSKAILLAGADFDAVSESDGNLRHDENDFIRVKSGVGVLNVQRSVEIAQNNAYCGSGINLKLNQFTGEYASYSRDHLNVEVAKTIRVVMCFSKPDKSLLSDVYGNNLDLRLHFRNNTGSVAFSNSIKNNVEVIQYGPTAAGQHKIRVDLTSYVSMASDSTDFNILYYGIAYCVLD